MLKLTVHSKGTGTCSLTRKEGRVFLVSFDADSNQKRHLLSAKGLEQYLEMHVEEPDTRTTERLALPVATATINGDRHD